MKDPPYTMYVLYAAFLFWPSRLYKVERKVQKCGDAFSKSSSISRFVKMRVEIFK